MEYCPENGFVDRPRKRDRKCRPHTDTKTGSFGSVYVDAAAVHRNFPFFLIKVSVAPTVSLDVYSCRIFVSALPGIPVDLGTGFLGKHLVEAPIFDP